MLAHTEANIEKTVKEESRKAPKNKSIFSLKTQGKYRKSKKKKKKKNSIKLFRNNQKHS